MVPSSFTRKFLIVFAFLVCVFYLAFRAMFTFNDSGPYALGASIALYVAECFGILNLFLFFVQVWEVNEPPAQPVLEGRTVDVFIPTLNEDPALLRATLEACVRMDYPHKTYVLDDGRRPEVEALARELGVNYFARPDNRHFKAGNLNHAFERTDGEFVVVLDADHVPEPHFITRLIGYFRDDRLGYVQTPHAFYNFDSFQARLDHKNRKYWEEGHTFYYVIQPGRNNWGCPIFAGSAAMFRRNAIRDVGLMATETITEDMHTGLRMNAKGWRSLAISERLVAGQAAPDITTFHAQRMRWGTGNLSIMKYDNPLFVRGLTLPQRLCYLGSMLHWASGFFKLIIYLTPIAMLFSGIPPVKEFTRELIGITLIYLIVSLTVMKIVSNGYGSIINSELFSMVNFWTQIKSTFRAIFGFGSRQFNVTPKGTAAQAERKKRGVWQFIRPQTYLIILSVLALFWGWSRRALGISDDQFKPVVPTIWVLIHFWLAYKVTQRAFWPADRRIATRHPVNVPVEYDTVAASGAPRYGVTVDLNDTGMAYVAYERFAPGDVLRFTIRGAGEVVKCKGEIRTVSDLTRGQVADGFRYGVLFQNLTPLQTDALNRICLHYGVPRSYKEFDAKRGGLLGGFQKKLDRGMAQRRSEFRNPYRLPIVINSGVTEDTAQFSATEDLSRSAVAAVLENELPKNAPVGYLMASPLGEVRGTAKVMRSTPEVFGGRTYYRTVIEFTDYEGQGRTTLHSLVNPQESGPLKEVLKPEKKPVLVQMAGATLVAILIIVPLVLLQGGLFQWFHKDDYVLRDIGDKQKRGEEATDADREQVKRILDETLKEDRPSSDRLVLLMNALNIFSKPTELEQQRRDKLLVAEQLAKLNTGDLSLRQSLLYANLNAGRFNEAMKTYEDLKAHPNYPSKLDADQKFLLELSRARILEARANNAAERAAAAEAYRPLYEEKPEYVPTNEQGGSLRREYAGVLLKAGGDDPKFYDAAVAVLQPSRPEDIEARQMLVAAHLLKGRAIATNQSIPDGRRKSDEFAEYKKAEDVANALESYGTRKGSGELVEVAQTMKADVQMARTSWEGAKEIMDKLAEQHGGDLSRADPGIVRRVAQVQLGGNNYAGALNAFAALLSANPEKVSGDEKTAVIKGFLDAAAHPSTAIAEREKAVAKKIVAADMKHIDNDAVYMARLGWVLQRAGENEDSKKVLEQAIARSPSNADLKEQLANVLIASDQIEAAAKVLSDANIYRGRELLIGVYFKTEDYAKAAAEIDRTLADFKVGARISDARSVTAEDIRKMKLLKGVALYLPPIKALKSPTNTPEQFGPAIIHYQQMSREYPNDGEVMTALGNVFLFQAERTANATDKQEAYASALKQFQQVLTEQRYKTEGPATRAKVEAAFIDAAAGVATLPADSVALARDVATRSASGAPPAPIPSARLAYILLKTNDAAARADAVRLLKQAEANLTKDEERRELANVYAAAKDFESSARLLEPMRKTVDDTVHLAKLLSGGRKWKEARVELARIIADPTATPAQKKEATRDLARVTAWSGDHAEAIRQLDEIVKADPDDLESRTFRAEVNVWKGDFARALEEYTALAKQSPDNAAILAGFLNAAAKHASKSKQSLGEEARALLIRAVDRANAPDNKDALLLARAAEATAVALDDRDRALILARKAYAAPAKTPIERREIAYVLANERIGMFKEADALIGDMELSGKDRMNYVFIASQAENFDAARRQARLYLAEVEKEDPGSLAHRDARRLLADVLTWKGDYEDALAIYNQLNAENKGDLDLRVKIAEANRYWGNYPVALQKFAELLAENVEQRKLWTGFIDAASSAPDIEGRKDLLMQIHNRFAPEVSEPKTLSRLAWIMWRLNEPARAHPLLDRAVASRPAAPAVRKELAGVLAAVFRTSQAIEMLSTKEVLASMDMPELLKFAELLTADEQRVRAEEVLAKVVNESSERNSRVLYGKLLLWNKKHVQAQGIFGKLKTDYPNDFEIALLLGQSYLWSERDYTTALKYFTEIVAAKVDPVTKTNEPLANPDIWMGYIDAASGTVGESLRQFPRRSIGPMFTAVQRDAIFRAYDHLARVRDTVMKQNAAELTELNAARDAQHPTFDARRAKLVRDHRVRVDGLAGSMGRLGLLLGLLGDRDRSGGAFGAALAINDKNRDVWLQYAQTLTALGDDVRAKQVYDWLLSNPDSKLPAPQQIIPK